MNWHIASPFTSHADLATYTQLVGTKVEIGSGCFYIYSWYSYTVFIEKVKLLEQ